MLKLNGSLLLALAGFVFADNLYAADQYSATVENNINTGIYIAYEECNGSDCDAGKVIMYAKGPNSASFPMYDAERSKLYGSMHLTSVYEIDDRDSSILWNAPSRKFAYKDCLANEFQTIVLTQTGDKIHCDVIRN